jgi:hypothetical protein
VDDELGRNCVELMVEKKRAEKGFIYLGTGRKREYYIARFIELMVNDQEHDENVSVPHTRSTS